jgi:AmmeMemoRadiSam system protein B
MRTPSEAKARVRPAVHAGRFYPEDAIRLRAEVAALLGGTSPQTGPVPKAMIAPHAGYVYSGPIAASAYACLQPVRDRLRRVVLIGPSHSLGFHGVALSAADAFATPLGLVGLDDTALAQVRKLPAVQVNEEAHRPEHCLEVQLPFLQVVLPEFRLVPLLVGEAGEAEVADVLDALWGGAETCVIVSSDLSHYQDYATALVRDRRTAAAIVALQGNQLDPDCACGWEPIRGLLCAARRRGLKARTIDLRNSGDTAGGRDRVVGYGVFAFASLA